MFYQRWALGVRCHAVAIRSKATRGIGEGGTPTVEFMHKGRINSYRSECWERGSLTTEGAQQITRRLLVVEDQDLLAETITTFLHREGFAVDHANSLSRARECLGGRSYDLVILDITLPDGDGLELLPLCQLTGGPAVIIVSGKGDEHDRVLALELGADDYLVKPFSLRELAARVRCVLRRSLREGGAIGRALEFGPYRLNPADRSLSHATRGEVLLTTAEFDVLLCLARHQATVVTREVLTEKALNRQWQPLDRSVDQIIVSLRRKLEEGGELGVRIVTVRGRGYLLRAGRL